MKQVELAWLGGLLEGEGSFLKGPPSSPNQPRISLQMTDYDVIWRVSKMFGVSYIYGSSDRRSKSWKKVFKVMLKGRRAIAMMKLLRPFMGTRRRKQIDVAIKSWKGRS